MNRLGMIVDLSGSARVAVHRVFEKARAPVIFSKSGAYAVSRHNQNIHDDTLELLVSLFISFKMWVLLGVFRNKTVESLWLILTMKTSLSRKEILRQITL